jgi:D-aminopeptidase
MVGVSQHTADIMAQLSLSANRAGYNDVRFVINDAHASMVNHDPTHPCFAAFNIRWIVGKPKPFGMMAGLDTLHTEIDTVVLLGHHAKAMTPHGNLAHSFTSMIRDIRINGTSIGEAGLNLLLSELGFGLPVWGLLGDAALQQELNTYGFPHSVCVTKQALSWSSSLLHPWTEACKQIQHWGAPPTKNTPLLSLGIAPSASAFWQESSPWQVELELQEVLQADVLNLDPRLTRLNGCTVTFSETEPHLPTRMQTLYRRIQSYYTFALASKLMG